MTRGRTWNETKGEQTSRHFDILTAALLWLREALTLLVPLLLFPLWRVQISQSALKRVYEFDYFSQFSFIYHKSRICLEGLWETNEKPALQVLDNVASIKFSLASYWRNQPTQFSSWLIKIQSIYMLGGCEFIPASTGEHDRKSLETTGVRQGFCVINTFRKSLQTLYKCFYFWFFLFFPWVQVC